MTQDKQARARRTSTYRGFMMIIVGIVVLIVAAARDDDYSWQGILLGGISLAYGAFLLIRVARG